MSTIAIQRRQLLIHGTPRVILAGEIHYFRVPRQEWEQRIDLLVEAGCNTVASYLPWLLHELPDGSLDVDGTTDPVRDVGAFIDLCASKGLWFIARPGPFIMAELKNEGLPYSVYRDHPEIIPVGWDAKPTPSATVDYLAPAFLAEVERWYAAIMPVIASRLITRGGPVISVQLDNEIGMLAWVTNSPDLTEHLVADLARWVADRHGARVAERYPSGLGVEQVRSPQEDWAAALRVDLTEFMRDRFGRYAEALRASAERHGVVDVPFLINIHGTEGGGGESFPIGISQLVDTYSRRPGMVSGSDHYVGDLNLATTTDLYVMNALQAAVHDDDQPITSLEFEAGSGDYGGGFDQQYDPATADLKTRLFLAQGNRMINYYLLAGGINPPLLAPVGDGNDRISFTGERHGTAAPISPEGTKSPTFEPVQRVVHAASVLEPWLATSSEELDSLSLGFVLDSYATEYAHPDSPVMQQVVTDLRRFRGAGPRRALARSALLRGHRFDAVDLQHGPARRVDGRPVTVMLTTSRHLSAAVQQRLVEHLQAGGSLLMLGRLPELDLEARPCRILADALEVEAGELITDSPHFYPSVVAHGWAAPHPETRVGWLQELVAPVARAVLTDVSGRVCGVDVPVGAGRAVLFAAELPSSPVLFGRALDELGPSRGLELTTSAPGVFATTTRDDDGGRLLHLINYSGYRVTAEVVLDGQPVFGGGLQLAPYRGWMLPLGLRVGQAQVWSNAEISLVDGARIEFGEPVPSADYPGTFVRLETSGRVLVDGLAKVLRGDGWVEVLSHGPVTVTLG